MENGPQHISSQPEKTPKELLEEQRAVAKERYDSFKSTEPEAYDKDLSDLYFQTRGMNEQTKRLYLGSQGISSQQLFDNNEKRKLFLEQAEVLSKEYRTISREIDEITRNEEAKERKENFDREKESLSTALYEALDGIHSQIPEVAKNVGMTTEMALKQYLPKLESKASQIEYYINLTDEAETSRDLEYIKKRLEQEKLP